MFLHLSLTVLIVGIVALGVLCALLYEHTPVGRLVDHLLAHDEPESLGPAFELSRTDPDRYRTLVNCEQDGSDPQWL